jgi:hypothetical protein
VMVGDPELAYGCFRALVKRRLRPLRHITGVVPWCDGGSES